MVLEKTGCLVPSEFEVWAVQLVAVCCTDCFVQAPQYLSSWLAVLKTVEIWC